MLRLTHSLDHSLLISSLNKSHPLVLFFFHWLSSSSTLHSFVDLFAHLGLQSSPYSPVHPLTRSSFIRTSVKSFSSQPHSRYVSSFPSNHPGTLSPSFQSPVHVAVRFFTLPYTQTSMDPFSNLSSISLSSYHPSTHHFSSQL